MNWSGRTVCVTGAGGTIGSRLCAMLRERGARLLMLDHSELALYLLMEKIGNDGGHIADIRDYERLLWLFKEYRPSVVFNAAALKHVPMCERDVVECQNINVGGFNNVCVAAARTGVDAVIQISTDKAVDPVNWLGRSKRSAEVLAAEHVGATCVVAAVRFHNILGSSGSVLQKFLGQIAAGGPVTVTHPGMVRTFGSAAEACEKLLLCAEHAMGPDGRALYALDAGHKIRIVDLARYLIGEKSVKIVYTGMRPGERLEEKLVGTDERAIGIGVDGVFAIEWCEVRPAGDHLRGAAGDVYQVRADTSPQA